MNGKHYIGAKAQSANNARLYPAISKIILWVDDNNCYEAGTDGGFVIEQDCPYATQAMADNLLVKLGGYQYQSITAEAAQLTPTAELGDGITVNGIYTQLAYKNIRFSTGAVVDVAAPGGTEVDHEYVQKGNQTREFNRKLAETYSLIEKTAEEIRLEVGSEIDNLSSSIDIQLDSITGRINGLDGDFAEISLTLDGLTVTGPDGSTQINGGKIDADDLYVKAANITGTLSANQINMTGAISWGDLNSSVQSNITSAQTDATSAKNTINEVTVTEEDWYGNVYTYIDESKIRADSIYANQLHLGGNLTVYRTLNGTVAGGYLGYTSSSQDGTAAIHMQSGLGEVVATQNGAKLLYGGVSNQVYVQNGSVGIAASGRYYYFNYASFNPGGTSTLGTSANLWGQIYSTNSTISTSDQNLKHDIETLPEKYVVMLDNIEPKRYKLNDGTSDRYHPGFIAQDVKEAMDKAGIADTEFGGWCKDVDDEGNEIQMLRYGEFVAPMLAKIKQLESRIKILEASA